MTWSRTLFFAGSARRLVGKVDMTGERRLLRQPCPL